MRMEVFKPKAESYHKFAVAVPTKSDDMIIIGTYETLKQLEIGYKKWLEYASTKNITKPYPIQLLDQSGKYKILEEIIDAKN